MKREQTRAEVLCKAVAPKLCVLHLKRQASRSCGLLINTGIKQIALMLQRAGLCDRLAQDLQLHLPAFLSFVQAAEKKLQELQASVKQSEDAEAQVSGLKRELEQVQATLQASKDAAKAADTEKVGGRSTHGTSLHILFLASCNPMPMPPEYAFISSRPEDK